MAMIIVGLCVGGGVAKENVSTGKTVSLKTYSYSNISVVKTHTS